MKTRRASSGSPYEPIIGFSRAVRKGPHIAVSGSGPIGPDGKTTGIGDPEMQARRCFEIVRKAIEDLGGTLNDVVRTRMYLTRTDDWEMIGKVHGEYFRDIRPAATMVIVQNLVDPDWFIEVEADAIVEER